MSEELKSVIIQERWLKDNRCDIFYSSIEILGKAWQEYDLKNFHGLSGEQLMQLAGMLRYIGMDNKYEGPDYRLQMSGARVKGMDLKIILDKEGIFSYEYLVNDSKLDDCYCYLQPIKVSANLTKEELPELGKKGPYYKYIKYPVELTDEEMNSITIVSDTKNNFPEKLDYDFSVNDNYTESVTFVGNTHVWPSKNITADDLEIPIDNPLPSAKIEAVDEPKKINFREFL